MAEYRCVCDTVQPEAGSLVEAMDACDVCKPEMDIARQVVRAALSDAGIDPTPYEV